MSTEPQLPPGVTKNAAPAIPLPPLARTYRHGQLPPGKTRAKMHAATHVPTPPNRKREAHMRHYRHLIDLGEQVMADAYARERGLDVPLAVLSDELVGEALPLAPATAAHALPARNETLTKLDPAAPPPVWPENARVVVWTTCPNPKLVVCRLPDGRTASLWSEGLPGRPVGIECDVHLEKRTGDPIYRLDRVEPIVTHPNA